MSSRLTDAQRRALGGLRWASGPRSAAALGVRRDVLWRLEGMGFVRETLHGEWSIKTSGEQAYDEWWARAGADIDDA